MNKFKLFPLALAAFAFSACTSEDAVENNPNVEGVKSYVAVNINNVGAGGTRADEVFENGTAAESKINTIRFYFFTQNGDPYKLADGNNWLEIAPTQLKESTGNVEKITNSMLVIKGKDMTYPQSMMAVVNPETIEAGKLKDFMKKSDVEGVVAAQNFKAQTADAPASDFVMTSSVYAQDGKTVWTSDISGHVALTEDAALQDPVDIYVERVAAKITSTASGATDGKFLVGETATGTPVYAKIEGWGIAKENTKANLIKVIDPAWTEAAIGFNWNDANFYRSYWETTPENDGTYKSWADYAKTQIGNVYYTAPNTSNAPIYVAAAKLVDKDGKALEISKYKGVQYLSEDDVKKVILNENKSKNFYKVVSTTEAGTMYESLDVTDLVFVVDAAKPYEVKAQVKAGVEVYQKAGEVYTVATAAANTAFGANNAVIYKHGMTYYWTSVKHLGASGKIGEFGMVRNHFYKVDVTKISGFGTAVYDKNTDFVPVTPDEDPMTYLAARINVLSWRVVGQTVELK